MATKTENNKKSNIEYDYSQTQSIFSDIVEISFRGDYVCLNIGLKSHDKDMVNVSHSLYLTLPHYMRLVQSMGSMATTIDNLIEEGYEELQANLEEKHED